MGHDAPNLREIRELQAELAAAKLQKRDLLALLKRFTDLDCCTGYTLSRDDYAKFWDALDDARRMTNGDVEKRVEDNA